MGAYKRDSAGINAMLASHDILGEAMAERADAVAAEARATAPYDERTAEHFKDTIHAEVITDKVLSRHGPHDAIVGHIYSDDPAALSIETGTKNTPAHNTLSQALGVLGGQ